MKRGEAREAPKEHAKSESRRWSMGHSLAIGVKGFDAAAAAPDDRRIEDGLQVVRAARLPITAKPSPA